MSDFHQNGLVTVLHRIGGSNLEQLEKELERHAASNPIALVLPSLYSELENPALKHIVQVLKDIRYVNEIVISLDRASALEFRLAKQFFSVLPQRVRIVWNDGAGIQDILKLLAQAELDTGLQGKGRGCWMAFGYVLARGASNVIALHDCDILSYNREYLARLCYPIVNPNLGYEFCKGYYSRVTNRLHGRVTRLYFTPLIRSLQQVAGAHPLLTFLDSFRYPLAGEFAMVRDLAWTLLSAPLLQHADWPQRHPLSASTWAQTPDLLAETGYDGGPLNIGCGDDLSIRQLAEAVCDTVGYRGRLVFDASKPDGMPRKLLDSSRIGALGWRPTVPLAEGLRRAYEAAPWRNS